MAISSATSLNRSSLTLISPRPSSTLSRTVFVLVQRRFLLQDADGGAGCQERVAVVGLVQAGHDPQDARLAGPVRADDADLGSRQEAQRDVVEDDLVAVRLADLAHRVDVFGHAVGGAFRGHGDCLRTILGNGPTALSRQRQRLPGDGHTVVVRVGAVSSDDSASFSLAGAGSASLTLSRMRTSDARQIGSDGGRAHLQRRAPDAVAVVVLAGVDVPDGDHRTALA